MCRECGRDVTYNHPGDDGTKFFKCQKCGIISETKVETKRVEVPNIKYEPPENPTDQTILIQRLKEVNLSTRRFLKVDEKKAAFELEWEKHLYGPEDLHNYPRWGICGKTGLVPCDVDKPEMITVFREQLPETLVAVSPRRGLPHFYYKVVGGEVPNKTLHIEGDYDEEGRLRGAGEIRSQNQYLVAPGTTIKYKDLKTGEPKIGTYKIIENRPIATVTFERFMEVIKPYLGKDSSQKITKEIMEKGVGQGTRHAYGIKYATRLIRFEHLDPVAALDILKRWNQKCRPPMAEKDLERMIRNAVSYAQNDTKEKDQTKQDFEEIISEIAGKDVFAILFKTLSRTVKRDHYAKQFDLLHSVSAYCNSINLLKDSPTSTGKTYPLIQAVKLFPPEDVMLLGGLSPTALAHQHGVPVDEEGTPLTPKINELQEKIDQLELDALGAKRKEKAQIRIEQKQLKRELAIVHQTAHILVNLENKIMVFLENPHPETWARLRPIMSHDQWRIAYKFTDRVGTKGPLRQVTVVIEGWPVFIAFKAEHQNPEIWDQILSRGTNVPVEMSRMKYRAGVKLEALKRGLPQSIVDIKLHKSEVERARQIVRAVKKRLLEIKNNIRKQTGMDAIPNMFWIPFYKKIGAGFPAEIGVHMRESQRFLTIIQMHAAINVYTRPILEIDGVEHIICTLDDYQKAFHLFFSGESKSVIFSKLPKHKVDFFEKVLLPLWEIKRKATLDEAETKGISTKEMRKKYFLEFDKPISSNTINYHYLRVLEDMNFISRASDPDNKTRKLTVVLTKNIASEESPIETHFRNGDVFSLAELKEAFNRDFQLVHQTPPPITIKTYKNEELSLDELYAQFFSSRRGAFHIDSKTPKSHTTEEKKPVETPVSKTGDNGGFNPQTDSKKLEEIRNWIFTEQDEDREINRSALDEKISEYGLNSTEITIMLQKEGIIKHMEDAPGRWKVIPQKYTKDKKGLTLGEFEQKLRASWKKGTTTEFYELIHKNSDLDRKETSELVRKWLEDGIIFYNPEKLLMWVKGSTKSLSSHIEAKKKKKWIRFWELKKMKNSTTVEEDWVHPPGSNFIVNREGAIRYKRERGQNKKWV